MTREIVNTDAYTELAETMGADFANELVSTFLEDAPNMIAELKQAAATGDADAYRRAAHSLKSNADTFGAALLAAQAREMELTGLPETEPPIAALESIYAQTGLALKAMLDD